MSAMDGIKASTVELSKRMRAWFSASDWNRLLVIAGRSAGWYWIDHWMPKRWSPSYARSLGYDGRGQTPFYKRGEFITKAAGAHPIVRAKGGTVTTIRCVVPIGHPLQSGIMSSFKRIPQPEAYLVAQEFRKAALRVMLSANVRMQTRGKGAGRMRARLSAAQRTLAAEARRPGAITPATDRVDRLRNLGAGLRETRASTLKARYASAHGGDHTAIARGTAGGWAGVAAGLTPETAPAAGRQLTARGANQRYRHSERGRAKRRMQARRARTRDRMMAHTAMARMEPDDRASRFSRRTLKSHGFAT